MAKSKASQGKPRRSNPGLFPRGSKRRQRALILPRFLAQEANHVALREDAKERGAHAILMHWAHLEKEGHLNKKETALDAGYLEKVFGDALGYKTLIESPTKYQLERNFTVPGVGTADGALGQFASGRPPKPFVVIELKDADTDLDRDKFNGRTAVQQCWDYLNALPECPWGIVSNFVTMRLYHRDKSSLAYQEFELQELRKPESFAQFYCLFESGSFIPGYTGQQPRAVKLLDDTTERQREVGNELYEAYSDNRYRLIEHLCAEHHKSLDQAIHIAQKILDRIIFIAFCEDRRLLPENCLKTTYSTIPPITRVTNPRWRNFVDLFGAIDKGVKNDPFLDTGYNGGLFRHDPPVDDLQLDDSWTEFFKNIGTYDFRHEVNVDVLGHIFEKSVGELEQVRVSGLFGTTGTAPKSAMPKSAERKRFGIYYTPPDFTQFIVAQTVGAVIDRHQKDLLKVHKLTEEDLGSDEPSPSSAAYWRDCLDRMHHIKVCDPACGSGAFLIEAFDVLEERYRVIVENLAFHSNEDEHALLAGVPDRILTENLYGVDLSEQAVEITQLALWLRSADNGKKLTDLSRNIVWGNSLVTDQKVHPKAITWEATFPDVFNRPNRGFDAVIGNPPWERMKLQEREFFAHSAPKIAEAVKADKRAALIAELEQTNPELFARYKQAQENADKTLAHVRKSGEFPLTAKGDINTYALFAELARKIVAPDGRVGLLVPSGIATDNTTREFFATLMESKSLAGLYDFENRLKIFPDVDGRFKFSALLFGGSKVKAESADFVFFAHKMEDLKNKQRHIALSAKDIALLNPNTRTCPIFRTRRDAELTKVIYGRVPVLIDKTRKQGGNPWGIKFSTMFHQTNDAKLFHSPEQLKSLGFKLDGNRWVKGQETYLPLYEAKMVQAYDHRAASVVIEEGNWVRQGQTEATTLVAHQNPEFVVQPRWWVDETEVLNTVDSKRTRGFIGFKDITSPTNERTMIAAAIPWAAVTNHFPLIFTTVSPRREMCLLANLNSLILDYVVRQKIGGVTLNFFIVEQLPIIPPDRYSARCPWHESQTLEEWIAHRVLALTCTANDMQPLATATMFEPPVWPWDPDERAELTAELDAAYCLLYGIERDDLEYVLKTFGLPSSNGDSCLAFPSSMARIIDAYERFHPEPSFK